MKAIVIVFTLAALAALVECGNHSKGKKNNRDGATGGDAVQWPHPDSVSDFQVPDVFTGGPSLGSDADGDEPSSSSSKQHAKLNQKHRIK